MNEDYVLSLGSGLWALNFAACLSDVCLDMIYDSDDILTIIGWKKIK